MKLKAVSGIMLTLLLLSMLTFAFNIQLVKASGTIYIRADGSFDPPTAPISTVDNVTYTFTGFINEPIVVERDNIIVDGAGHTLQGLGSGYGIYLNGRSNVTIKNIEIGAFEYGTYLHESSNNSVSGNNITNNWYGIRLFSSSNNVISGNNITGNNWYGIRLFSSSNNTLRNNDASNNSYNFGVHGTLLSHYIQDIDDSNTVNDKPIYYWVNRRDMAVPLDEGWIALVNCTCITVQNLNLTNNWEGVLLAFTTNSTITGNNITNNEDGIRLDWSSNNTVSGNNVKAHNSSGIYLSKSSNNTISGNDITANNVTGFELLYSNSNILSGNNVINNDPWGVVLFESSNNTFYHNNFINNTGQVFVTPWYINTWDGGYPSGGNYWSDCTGVDVKSGPNQDQPSSDGIGDTAYVIDANNIDHYPLTYPWGAPPPPSYTLRVYSSPTGVTFTVDGVSRTTPWSGTYSEGSSVSLVMPRTHDGYVWSHWLEDGDPDRIKTVTMDTDITLTAVYTRLTPVGGKAIPIDKAITKPELQIPWIWLSTIMLSLVLTVVHVKKKREKYRD